MLHVKPVIDDSCEAFLRAEGVETSFSEGVDVALYEEGALIGTAHVSFLTDCAVLEGVYVTPAARGKGYGDFLTRAVMDAYTRALPTFKVAYKSEYFRKFGFTDEESGMTIKSEEIKFPSYCGGHR